MISRVTHLVPINYSPLLILLLLGLIPSISRDAPSSVIDVSVSRSRVQRGEKVEIQLKKVQEGQLQAVLFTPTSGSSSLRLTPSPTQPTTLIAEVSLDSNASEGLYVVHAWTGPASSPTSVGKATFLLGRLITDFFIAPYVDSTGPEADVRTYFKDFRSVGGNFLIVHNLISPTKSLFPSKVVNTDVIAGSPGDIVELALREADKNGFPVLLSVSWDMTKQSAFKNRMTEIKAIARELYDLYKHHPSLAGFYSYQEGSGTYYAQFVREFSQFIKSLNPNLLTACAPHVDDPLLAGYLSTIENLDIIIYQAGVMASYRTDNRKKYPFRRVKDFCSLGAGAKLLQNKISINHVELFGYLENRLTPDTTATTYDNIYQQILSAATVPNADGISFFSYHAHVYETAKKLSQVAQSKKAVVDGIKAFDFISGKISRTNNSLAVYFPYSDWIIERWSNFFLPALDAFRELGIAVDVLPYAPPLEESVYPYYPFHANKAVLDRLLREQTVLVLPNVSGFQQTDSDLIKAFVEQGGVVVAFGPQIPMGRSYERDALFGIEETFASAHHDALIVKSAVGIRARTSSRFGAKVSEGTVWKLNGARLVASFEDGSPAIVFNDYGKGKTVTIVPDTWTAAQNMKELTRDVLEFALSLRGSSPIVEVLGANERTDLAMTQTAQGFRVAVVNHTATDLSVVLRLPGDKPVIGSWIDLVTDEVTKSSAESQKIRIPGRGFRAFEFRRN